MRIQPQAQKLVVKMVARPATKPHHKKPTPTPLVNHPHKNNRHKNHDCVNNISAINLTKLNREDRQKPVHLATTHATDTNTTSTTTANNNTQPPNQPSSNNSNNNMHTAFGNKTTLSTRELSELILGRLALCGFCSGIAVALFTGKTFLDQAALWPDNIVLIVLAVIGSCITVNVSTPTPSTSSNDDDVKTASVVVDAVTHKLKIATTTSDTEEEQEVEEVDEDHHDEVIHQALLSGTNKQEEQQKKKAARTVTVRFLPLFSDNMKVEKKVGRTAIIGFTVALVIECSAYLFNHTMF